MSYNQVIPEAAVEAAAKSFYGTAWDDCSPEDLAHELDRMRETLEAAAPHMLAETEWAIFRASDGPDGTPIGNDRFTTREAATSWIGAGFNQPELWEARWREVGEWAK